MEGNASSLTHVYVYYTINAVTIGGLTNMVFLSIHNNGHKAQELSLCISAAIYTTFYMFQVYALHPKLTVLNL